MNIVAARLQAFAEEIGTLGVVGIGLLVFALALALGLLQPLDEELRTARARVERLQARAASVEHSDGAARDDPQAQLAAFLKHFPPADDARQDILRLQSFAAHHGIELRSGEYRFAPETGTGLVRHQIALPVTGSYLEIRAFVTEALRELPSVALQSATLQRDSVAARQLEGRLQFVLYTTGS